MTPAEIAITQILALRKYHAPEKAVYKIISTLNLTDAITVTSSLAEIDEQASKQADLAKPDPERVQ